MSKLLDLLSRVNQGSSTPMGFGARASQERSPALVLAGQFSPSAKAKPPKLQELGLDAVILTPGTSPLNTMDQSAEATGGTIWGAAVAKPTPQDVASLKEAGCDFLLFQPDTISLEVLGDKDLGRLLEVSSALSEEHRLILGTLPVDALLLHADEEVSPLTLRHLMDIQAVIAHVDKPVLLFRRRPPSRGELEGLRDAGIEGLVLDASSLKAKVVRQLKEDIAALPQRRERPERGPALVPYPSPARAGAVPRREEEEEEDDEDF